MWRFLLIAVLALAAESSIAQTKFSFSGLDWGDSVDQTDAKLSTAGFQIPMVEKLACKVKKSCMVLFSGPVRGNAWFEDSRLTEVLIGGNQNSYSERADRLRARYGPPLPSQEPNDSSSWMSRADAILTLRWSAPSGESLTLSPYADIRYSSPAANRAKNQANEVKF